MMHHFQFLKKEAGKHVKNVILKEIQKILKKAFVVCDNIIHFSKQILIQVKN